MKCDLKKPCTNYPFRSDVQPYTPERVEKSDMGAPVYESWDDMAANHEDHQ